MLMFMVFICTILINETFVLRFVIFIAFYTGILFTNKRKKVSDKSAALYRIEIFSYFCGYKNFV